MGRSVMGTVSGSLRFTFFGFDGGASGAGAGCMAAGCAEINVGAGKEPRPAGWLAAAAIRAANSLESRFFFIGAYGVVSRSRDITVA